MVFKMYNLLVLVVALVSYSLADPTLCPSPEKAITLVLNETIHVDASSFGRVQKIIPIPTKEISCLLLTENDIPNHIAVASVGYSKDGLLLNLVSQMKQPIDALLTVYADK